MFRSEDQLLIRLRFISPTIPKLMKSTHDDGVFAKCPLHIARTLPPRGLPRELLPGPVGPFLPAGTADHDFLANFPNAGFANGGDLASAIGTGDERGDVGARVDGVMCYYCCGSVCNHRGKRSKWQEVEAEKIPIISLAFSAAALILTSACPFGISVGLGTLVLKRRFSSAETEVQGYLVWPWISYWEGIVETGSTGRRKAV
jgi:hypothetical protein